MHPRNPDYEARARAIFENAPFLQLLGIEAGEIGPGWCTAHIVLDEKHLQHDGFVHAGVIATLADHTAGASSGTVCGADEIPLTVEFKINLLRPAVGERLRCRAQVLKPGRMLVIAESEVYVVNNAREKLVAKAMVTLALVKPNKGDEA